MLTFPEFQATKRHVDDVAASCGCDDGEAPQAGFCYADGVCHIFEYGSEFLLIIGNLQWADSDLAKLERIVWALHYVHETDGAALHVDGGTLDDFVCGRCDAFGYTIDGDVFGIAFSGEKETYEPREAADIIDRFAAIYHLKG